METTRLSLKTKLGFGVCDLGGNLFFTIMGFYLLKFMTDVALLGAALAGTAIGVVKIVDMVFDPTVGFLSDRTKSRWGRRRPWMFCGAILLFFTMILQYTNPHIASQTWLFLWMAGAYILLTATYTMVNIPYGSLTPELTSGFDEQTTLNSYRMSFAVVGTFIGFGAVYPFIGMFHSPDTGWTAMGALMGAIMLVTAMITVLIVKEPKRTPDEAREQQNLLKTYAAAFRNGPFVMVFTTYALHICGTAMVQAVLTYYFQYIYGPTASWTLAGAALLVPVIPSIIWIWRPLAAKIGKKWSWNIGMIMVVMAVLAIFMFARQAGPTFFYVVMAFAGIGLATNYVMPYSTLPDTVELDYARHGVRREGAFYGVFNLMNKLGVAIAILLSGALLGAFGYVPNAAQSDLSKLGIQLLLGPIAAVFFIAGIVVFSFYPISRKYYDTEIVPRVEEWNRKKK